MFDRQGFFSQLPTLTTRRLILRKLSMQDARDMYEYSKDPEVARYVQWRAYESLSAMQSYLRYNQRQSRLNQPCSWGITFKNEGRVIGTIGFTWVHYDNRSGEIGYSIARRLWGQGVATEAVGAVLDYGFGPLNLHRIEAQHDVRNPASGRVMEKSGMQLEGLLRGRIYNKGSFADMKVYSILEDDWRILRLKQKD